MLRLHSNVTASRDNLSSTASSHALSAQSSRDYMETRSPTLASRSSTTFWSPTMSEVIPPSSATSAGSSQTQGGICKGMAKNASPAKSTHDVLTDTRKRLTSLLLSEITETMFVDGSETDQAFWKGLGGELVDKHFSGMQNQSEEHESGLLIRRKRFDFEKALATLMSQFAATCDPNVKLGFLVEADTLLALRESEGGVRQSTAKPTSQRTQERGQPSRSDARYSISDATVNGFRKLFHSHHSRPKGVFRDLQYIAALVPGIAVEYSARSTAFRHAALALTGLKKELCGIMVETADSIIAYHSNNRGHGRTPSTAQQQRDSATFPPSSKTPPAEDVAKYSMADAAHLLRITAKEGDTVAQRELATLYLTNPELMDHIIAPFARPKEVFKEELENKWRKNQDPARCDPVTMCVAHHWMSLSAKGGDALANKYLKQREEMESLP